MTEDNEDRVSAGELRAGGIQIDKEIPDCATIPRHALRISGCSTSVDGDLLKADIELEVHPDFKFEWVAVKFRINPDGSITNL